MRDTPLVPNQDADSMKIELQGWRPGYSMRVRLWLAESAECLVWCNAVGGQWQLHQSTGGANLGKQKQPVEILETVLELSRGPVPKQSVNELFYRPSLILLHRHDDWWPK